MFDPGRGGKVGALSTIEANIEASVVGTCSKERRG